MRIKKIITVLLCVVLIAVMALSPMIAAAAFADNGEDIVAEQLEEDTVTVTAWVMDAEDKIQMLSAQLLFMEFLESEYGEDYEYYYQLVIEEWGSVEAYLLSFGEKLPEERKTSWQKFVGWLSEYASVWAPPFAVAIVIIVALIGKKQFDKIVERIVNAKLKPIVGELNKQSKATVSILHSQKALLGNMPKFTDNVKELEESEKELTNG